MIIPIRTDNRLSRRPVVNYLIVAINAVVFLAQFAMPHYDQVIRPYMLDPVNPHLEQFFTSMFLHASWAHIVGNMIFLWVFGNAVNDRFGHVGYTAFYLGGGLLSAIGYVLLAGTAPVLGASGAISAVTGAYLILFPRVRVTLLAWLFYVVTPLEISSIYFLGFQFIFNLWASYSSAGGQVAYVAHASGYVYGIVIAIVLLAIGVLPRDVYDVLSLWKAWRRRAGYRAMTAKGYDPFGYGGVARPGSRPVEAQPIESKPRVGSPEGKALDLRQQITRLHGLGEFSQAADAYLQLVALVDDAVLPRQQQLDIANQLMAEHRYGQAADAYERLLAHYPRYEHIEDIQLMLGLIYGRYLGQKDKAVANLTRALASLHDRGKIAMAEAELASLQGRS